MPSRMSAESARTTTNRADLASIWSTKCSICALVTFRLYLCGISFDGRLFDLKSDQSTISFAALSEQATIITDRMQDEVKNYSLGCSVDELIVSCTYHALDCNVSM